MTSPPSAGTAPRTSFWLETCGEDLTPRPALQRDRQVDVAILGGGFSGLWTAYHLLVQQPDLDIAIVEQEVVGFGASGRNGGWASPRFPVDPHVMVRRFGTAVARETLMAIDRAVHTIGDICAIEGIDAHYRQTGLLSIARSAGQVAALQSTLDTFRLLGLDTGMALLSAQATHERVHATHIHAGLYAPSGAAVHPARLVRGLARAVERRGATIYEKTQATDIQRGEKACIVTTRGRLYARKTVVAAGEAYLTTMPQFHRSLLPMSSMIVLSEPLTQAQWDEVGWARGESLSSVVHTKNYLTRTLDGRILYGSRGAPYAFGSQLAEQSLQDEQTFAAMRAAVREWWPVLNQVGFSHAWGGYLGVPRDWMPSVGFDPASRFARLGGYTGRGVSTSILCGKLLAGLILGRSTGLEHLPFHRAGAPDWEVEPFRWMGVRYVQNAFARIDRADQAGERLPLDTALAEMLGEQ